MWFFWKRNNRSTTIVQAGTHPEDENLAGILIGVNIKQDSVPPVTKSEVARRLGIGRTSVRRFQQGV